MSHATPSKQQSSLIQCSNSQPTHQSGPGQSATTIRSLSTDNNKYTVLAEWSGMSQSF